MHRCAKQPLELDKVVVSIYRREPSESPICLRISGEKGSIRSYESLSQIVVVEVVASLSWKFRIQCWTKRNWGSINQETSLKNHELISCIKVWGPTMNKKGVAFSWCDILWSQIKVLPIEPLNSSCSFMRSYQER